MTQITLFDALSSDIKTCQLEAGGRSCAATFDVTVPVHNLHVSRAFVKSEALSVATSADIKTHWTQLCQFQKRLCQFKVYDRITTVRCEIERYVRHMRYRLIDFGDGWITFHLKDGDPEKFRARYIVDGADQFSILVHPHKFNRGGARLEMLVHRFPPTTKVPSTTKEVTMKMATRVAAANQANFFAAKKAGWMLDDGMPMEISDFRVNWIHYDRGFLRSIATYNYTLTSPITGATRRRSFQITDRAMTSVVERWPEVTPCKITRRPFQVWDYTKDTMHVWNEHDQQDEKHEVPRTSVLGKKLADLLGKFDEIEIVKMVASWNGVLHDEWFSEPRIARGW